MVLYFRPTNSLLHWSKWCLLFGWLLTAMTAVAAPVLGDSPPSLGEALAPDGSVRPGTQGTFDARQFRMFTASDGHPVFRPASTLGTGDERWQAGFSMAGPNYQVNAVTRSGSSIYVGGQFSTVGNVVARNVARWDGTSWSSLGAGTNNGITGIVYALAAAPNGDLYVGGRFTRAGAVPVNHIAKWNTAGWSALGSGMSQVSGQSLLVQTLAVAANGDLYAGGGFTQAGGVAANNVARWDGTAWSGLGTATLNGVTGTLPTVSALSFAANGDLYVGGGFTQASGISANRIAKWDGTTWSSLGSGIGTSSNGLVQDIEVVGNTVYVSGAFQQAGGLSVDGLAQWNGTSWSRLGGTGFANGNSNGSVTDIAFIGNDLYAGGFFQEAYGSVANFLAKWNGTSWSRLGTGIGIGSEAGGSVQALLPVGNELYVGGRFLTNGTRADNLAKWNGTSWSGLGTVGQPAHGFDAPVRAFVTGAAGIYAGGSFQMADGFSVEGVARWNGSSWSPITTGSFVVGMSVQAIVVAANGDVYAGGNFFWAGGVTANNVAKWNGTTWSALGTTTTNGVNGDVSAMALAPNGDLYVGGTFTQAGGVAVNNVAKWNGTTWSALGSGLTRPNTPLVLAMAMMGTDLYVGGQFSNAGGTTVTNLARWNGSDWSAVGPPPNGPVYALAAVGPTLYAGGRFAQIGGVTVNNVAKWDGTNWSALGTGVGTVNTSVVNTLAISGSEVYAGGSFTQAGGVAANNVARWDGTAWSGLGTGTNGAVAALAVQGGRLMVGGSFTAVGDETLIMNYVGLYDPTIATATTAKAAASIAELYPNPAQDHVTLTLPVSATARMVQLFDAQGRFLRQVPLSAGADGVTVPVDGLPAGVYLLHCGAATRRVVVH